MTTALSLGALVRRVDLAELASLVEQVVRLIRRDAVTEAGAVVRGVPSVRVPPNSHRERS